MARSYSYWESSVHGSGDYGSNGREEQRDHSPTLWSPFPVCSQPKRFWSEGISSPSWSKYHPSSRKTLNLYFSMFANNSQTLHRHGSRYPTTGSNVQTFGEKIANITGEFNATGALSFLNSWSYGLGAEIMVPKGRLELFESGVNHYYLYGHLYNPNSKIIARTTTQMRMREVSWHILQPIRISANCLNCSQPGIS